MFITVQIVSNTIKKVIIGEKIVGKSIAADRVELVTSKIFNNNIFDKARFPPQRVY